MPRTLEELDAHADRQETALRLIAGRLGESVRADVEKALAVPAVETEVKQ